MTTPQLVSHQPMMAMTGTPEQIIALRRSAVLAGTPLVTTSLVPLADGRFLLTGYLNPATNTTATPAAPVIGGLTDAQALYLMNTRPTREAGRAVTRSRRRTRVPLVVVATLVVLAGAYAAGMALARLVTADLHQAAATLVGFLALVLLLTAALRSGSRTSARHCPGAFHQ